VTTAQELAASPTVLACPGCGRHCGVVPTTLVAATTHRRTCRRCGWRWQVLVQPRAILGGEGLAQVLTWTRLGRRGDA
jgi:transcription elongation factor Elf1